MLRMQSNIIAELFHNIWMENETWSLVSDADEAYSMPWKSVGVSDPSFLRDTGAARPLAQAPQANTANMQARNGLSVDGLPL